MTEDQPVVLAVAADSTFAKQLAVTIASVSRTASRRHQIFVFHDGYGSPLIERVSESAGEAVDLCWLDARSDAFKDAHLPSWLPTATLFRLRIADLLPKDVDRVIYLDTDVAVRRPLDDIWNLDLEGQSIGAVRDAHIPWAAAPEGLPWRKLGVAPAASYFNCGVMVISTAGWRSQKISERALELLGREAFFNGDQCALNAVSADRWVPLDPEWNLQGDHLDDNSLARVTESQSALSRAIEDPAIIHFLHSQFGRPWEFGCTHPLRDVWFEHLDLTPWAGWRPEGPSALGMGRKVARRIRKAGRTLIRG
jgi:lipopolysaccharide biosynthesis glycosyltransferase